MRDKTYDSKPWLIHSFLPDWPIGWLVIVFLLVILASLIVLFPPVGLALASLLGIKILIIAIACALVSAALLGGLLGGRGAFQAASPALVPNKGLERKDNKDFDEGKKPKNKPEFSPDSEDDQDESDAERLSDEGDREEIDDEEKPESDGDDSPFNIGFSFSPYLIRASYTELTLKKMVEVANDMASRLFILDETLKNQSSYKRKRNSITSFTSFFSSKEDKSNNDNFDEIFKLISKVVEQSPFYGLKEQSERSQNDLIRIIDQRKAEDIKNWVSNVLELARRYPVIVVELDPLLKRQPSCWIENFLLDLIKQPNDLLRDLRALKQVSLEGGGEQNVIQTLERLIRDIEEALSQREISKVKSSLIVKDRYVREKPQEQKEEKEEEEEKDHSQSDHYQKPKTQSDPLLERVKDFNTSLLSLKEHELLTDDVFRGFVEEITKRVRDLCPQMQEESIVDPEAICSFMDSKFKEIESDVESKIKEYKDSNCTALSDVLESSVIRHLVSIRERLVKEMSGRRPRTVQSLDAALSKFGMLSDQAKEVKEVKEVKKGELTKKQKAAFRVLKELSDTQISFAKDMKSLSKMITVLVGDDTDEANGGLCQDILTSEEQASLRQIKEHFDTLGLNFIDFLEEFFNNKSEDDYTHEDLNNLIKQLSHAYLDHEVEHMAAITFLSMQYLKLVGIVSKVVETMDQKKLRPCNEDGSLNKELWNEIRNLTNELIKPVQRGPRYMLLAREINDNAQGEAYEQASKSFLDATRTSCNAINFIAGSSDWSPDQLKKIYNNKRHSRQMINNAPTRNSDQPVSSLPVNLGENPNKQTKRLSWFTK